MFENILYLYMTPGFPLSLGACDGNCKKHICFWKMLKWPSIWNEDWLGH